MCLHVVLAVCLCVYKPQRAVSSGAESTCFGRVTAEYITHLIQMAQILFHFSSHLLLCLHYGQGEKNRRATTTERHETHLPQLKVKFTQKWKPSHHLTFPLLRSIKEGTVFVHTMQVNGVQNKIGLVHRRKQVIVLERVSNFIFEWPITLLE